MSADDPVSTQPLLGLAAHLFANHPNRFGGIVLRGFGPVRDALVKQLVEAIGRSGPVLKMPGNVDEDRLLGGLDLTQTLATGTAVHRPGLIAQARGGVLIVPMAERLAGNIAAHLAQAIDTGTIAVILLDDGVEPDESPSRMLMERVAFHCDLTGERDDHFAAFDTPGQAKRCSITRAQRKSLAGTAFQLGISSMRPVIQAEQCARSLTEQDGSNRIDDEVLAMAAQLVLAPRATRLPAPEPSAPEPPPQPQGEDDAAKSEDSRKGEALPLDDLLLEAVAAAIPEHVLDQIRRGVARASKGQGGRAGRKEKSVRRGRPLGAVPGMPTGGKRLALLDTLRAAAPWQTIRQTAHGRAQQDGIQFRKSDLRVRRFEQNRESLTIFAVDASGSSALSRLAEAKGAVELMLANAHVKRSQVALVAFRQSGAEVLLPPTRSLTRARRALGALPGGGGTPLAAGLIEAMRIADAADKRGQTPTIAILTDGKANVTIAGEADRTTAMQEVEETARMIAAMGHHAVVLDIAPRPREEAEALASHLQGRYVPLPYARSAALVEAIESVGKVAA